MKINSNTSNDCSICLKPTDPFKENDILYLQIDDFVYDKIHKLCLNKEEEKENYLWKMHRKWEDQKMNDSSKENEFHSL